MLSENFPRSWKMLLFILGGSSSRRIIYTLVILIFAGIAISTNFLIFFDDSVMAQWTGPKKGSFELETIEVAHHQANP